MKLLPCPDDTGWSPVMRSTVVCGTAFMICGHVWFLLSARKCTATPAIKIRRIIINRGRTAHPNPAMPSASLFMSMRALFILCIWFSWSPNSFAVLNILRAMIKNLSAPITAPAWSRISCTSRTRSIIYDNDGSSRGHSPDSQNKRCRQYCC